MNNVAFDMKSQTKIELMHYRPVCIGHCSGIYVKVSKGQKVAGHQTCLAWHKHEIAD